MNTSILTKSNFKDETVRKEWSDIRPLLQGVLIDMLEFCIAHEKPFMITDLTSTEAEDKKYKRTSPSHREKRAADLRTRFWDEGFIDLFIEYFNDKYKKIAAISAKSMKPTLIIRHVGTADHLHVQIRR